MAKDDFSEPPRRADSETPIFIFFADFWVRVTSEARGSVSLGFWGSRQFSPFGGGSSQGALLTPPPPQLHARLPTSCGCRFGVRVTVLRGCRTDACPGPGASPLTSCSRLPCPTTSAPGSWFWRWGPFEHLKLCPRPFSVATPPLCQGNTRCWFCNLWRSGLLLTLR